MPSNRAISLPNNVTTVTAGKSFRVLSVIGTRPEAIKMAPVILRLAQTPGIDSQVCVTAQHRQMLDQVLAVFGIWPDVDLNLMQADQSLAESAASILAHLDPVLRGFRPDWILAQGDTTTVMATGLLAYFNQVRFGHVEAGLRTGDKWQPFPEEINRKIAGVTADLHFAPTEWSRQNLLRENISPDRIIVTGNPVIDALHSIADRPMPGDVLALFQQIGFDHRDPDNHLVLVTAHRRENFGAPLERICSAIQELAKIYQDRLRILYPVHLNPHVQEPVHRLLANIPNITLLPPLDYLPLVHILKRATLVLTDSGGLQEEAPGLGVPVLVMRRVTERPEGVQAGVVRLVGDDPFVIITETRRLLDDPTARAAMTKTVNPYGDGYASERIVQALLEASQ